MEHKDRQRRPTPHSSRRRCAASKITPIVKAGIGSTALPIYRGGAAQCWSFGGEWSVIAFWDMTVSDSIL